MNTRQKPMKTQCPLCENMYEFSHGVYRGSVAKGWEIGVCDVCYEMNWDGWHPSYETKLLAHLAVEGVLPPKKNSKGFLPRDFVRAQVK